MNKKSIQGVRSLLILLILASFTFYSAYNFQKHIQELNVWEEKITQIQSQQELFIRLMAKNSN